MNSPGLFSSDSCSGRLAQIEKRSAPFLQPGPIFVTQIFRIKERSDKTDGMGSRFQETAGILRGDSTGRYDTQVRQGSQSRLDPGRASRWTGKKFDQRCTGLMGCLHFGRGRTARNDGDSEVAGELNHLWIHDRGNEKAGAIVDGFSSLILCQNCSCPDDDVFMS